MERITIIGTGVVGVSVGLALKRANLRNTEIVGSSGDRDALKIAYGAGAYDEQTSNLRNAVRGAQMIILDSPFTQTRELMDAIAPIVEDGCVITDTCAAKVRAMEWAEQILPSSVSFVAGRPLIRKPYTALEDASADLFQGAHYCISPGRSADETSVKTVVGMVELIGAKPLFLDPHEHDSYAVAMEVLPTVLSSAFVTTTAGSESWREMHQLAAATFAEYSRLASEDPIDNEAACYTNIEALVHWIDEYITELYLYRNMIKDSNDELVDTFIKAWEGRARWDAGAVVDTGENTLPTAGMSMATAFFGEKLTQRYQQMTGGEEKNKNAWTYLRNR